MRTLASSTTPSPFARILGAIAAVRGAWQRRKVVRQLVALDDYLLRDIGITRQDVESALAGPGAFDPTVRLAERARDARVGRRAAALEDRAVAALLSQADAARDVGPARSKAA